MVPKKFPEGTTYLSGKQEVRSDLTYTKTGTSLLCQAPKCAQEVSHLRQANETNGEYAKQGSEAIS